MFLQEQYRQFPWSDFSERSGRNNFEWRLRHFCDGQFHQRLRRTAFGNCERAVFRHCDRHVQHLQLCCRHQFYVPFFAGELDYPERVGDARDHHSCACIGQRGRRLFYAHCQRNGASFQALTVLWNGTGLPTTLLSATQLTAAVDASLIACSPWGARRSLFRARERCRARQTITVTAGSNPQPDRSAVPPGGGRRLGYYRLCQLNNTSAAAVSVELAFYADDGAAFLSLAIAATQQGNTQSFPTASTRVQRGHPAEHDGSGRYGVPDLPTRLSAVGSMF